MTTWSESLLSSRTLLRVYVWEEDKYQGAPLYSAIAEMLRHHGLAGATVVRGLMGFGARAAHVPAGADYLLGHVPVVIECADTDEQVQRILPELARMVTGGLIVLERVRILVQRSGADGANGP